MDSIEIKNIDFELLKVNAIKLKNREKNDSENVKEKKDSMESRLNVDIKQSTDDKSFFEVFLFYRIPSVQDYDINVDAEFYAHISLEEPFDIEKLPEANDKLSRKGFSNFTKQFMPKLLRETDKVLGPIFKSMNMEYIPLK